MGSDGCSKLTHWGTFGFVNRPPGVFEMAKFEAGTKAVMDFVVNATAAGAISIIGK